MPSEDTAHSKGDSPIFAGAKIGTVPDAEQSQRSLAATALVLAAILFVFPLAIPFPLLDPDEGLHASIAQEMVERGDWTTPRLLGQPFLDKPILYFWTQAASLWLFGMSEAAIRLPGLIFGLLGAVTTGLLGWRLFDRRLGLIAGILYATTILPTAMAQAASHDVALIPWINLALLLLWEADRAVSRRATIVCTIAAGCFVGLAVLTKGLSGVAVVGVAYGGYLAITRKIRPALFLRGIVVIAIAVLVAAPWYLSISMQFPDYLRYFFLERHLKGFATDSQPHGDGPWWYYLPVLLGGGLPWIGYLPIVVSSRGEKGDSPLLCDDQRCASVPAFGPFRQSSRHAPRAVADGTRSVPATLLWTWLIGWTALMMFAGSQLATYVWPAFPPIAILAATAWNGLIEGTLSASARRSFARTFVGSTCTGPIALPAAALAIQWAFDIRFAWPVWAAVGVAAALSPLPMLAWRAGRWQTSLLGAAMSVALQFVVIMAMVVPAVAETFSARELAAHFSRQGVLPPRLLVVEGRIGSLIFYLDPQLRAAVKPDQLQQLPAARLPRLEPGDVLAVPTRKIARFKASHNLNDCPCESIGSYQLYQVTLHRSPQR